MGNTKVRSTTVIAVRRNGKVAMAGDGQVTMGQTVMKGNARKVRKMCLQSDRAAIMRMPQHSPYSATRTYQPAKLLKRA